MDECADRLENPLMEYYKHVYQDSQRWNEDCGPLKGKVIVYAEQGYGDVIQFARYLPMLKEKGCEVVYHCPKPLHRLFGCLDIDLLDKENPELPDHDFHVLSMSLPFILGEQRGKQFPYLTVPEKADLETDLDIKKIGICWEGSPNNLSAHRNCPLSYFKVLENNFTKLFTLQKDMYSQELLNGCADMNLYGTEMDDFYDTAKIINALDMVVTVDTAVLHLAGAMNKLVYGLLNVDHDPRWDIDNWYDSAVIVRIKEHNNWHAALKTVVHMCTGLVQDMDTDKDFADDI